MNNRKTELYSTREPAVPPRRTPSGKKPPRPEVSPKEIIGDYDPPEEDMFWAKH